ncbi:MAG: hypothetical protein M1818_006546 [Claussenomyces sp. TS43310]|nr:MAG: hypothetical protein M1818_006546 [Claussenomyces sp. TS43310]
MSTLLSSVLQSPSGDVAFPAIIIAGILATIGILAFYGADADQPYPGIPVVGKGEKVKSTTQAKQVWLKSAKNLIYDTLKATGRPFQVLASTGPLIILPAHHMDEIRNDDRMTFGRFLKSAFFTSYPGFQGFRPAVDNEVFTSSVRIGLTQAIGQITGILSREMGDTLADVWPLQDEWKTTYFNPDSLKIIARLSSRTFLPDPLCHDPDWLRISVEYTLDFFAAAYALRLVPVPLRPIAHWFLPQTRKARKDVEIATRKIQPEVDSRRAKAKAAREAGKEYDAPADALTWMARAAEKHGISNYNLAWGQLNYSLGAIHTTAITFMNCVYDLTARPEYIDLLREEIDATGWKEGDEMNKTILYKLKLMDSFMKESQRLSPVTLIPINRIAHEDVTLSDGTKIPKGAILGVPITAMTDGKYQEDPLTFNGHRFYDKRQQDGNESKFQFVTTSNDFIAFGHGKHACPGRFFASNEIKIALVHMLTKYDMRFPPGKGRPESIPIGVSMAPNPKGEMQYRKRQHR